MSNTSCVICKEAIKHCDTIQRIFDKGHAALLTASTIRNDNLQIDLEMPYRVHVQCFKEYTRKTSITAAKRKAEAEPQTVANDTVLLRSETQDFRFKENCLFCAERISVNTKYAKSRRRDFSCVETLEFLPSIVATAHKRNDKWGNEVLVRVGLCCDLIAEEARYHRDCYTIFKTFQKHPSDSDEFQNVGRPNDASKVDAFQELCLYLEENDECQYSLSELLDIQQSFLNDGEEGYSEKTLKEKLTKKYGDQVIITTIHSQSNVVTFREKGHEVLQNLWKFEKKFDVQNEKESIISMAASFIRDDIKTQVYNCSEYPSMDNMECMIPDSLYLFLDGVIKSKAAQAHARRCTSIAHAIISACRPRSFISPILLAIAVYIYQKHASRELIDILSSLGFSDDYKEVQRMVSSFIRNGDSSYNLKTFSQFVFDNADFNVATLTGRNTFHAMGGIACVTPHGNITTQSLPRNTDIPCAATIGRFGQIPIKSYKKPPKIGLSSVSLEALDVLDSNMPCQKMASFFDLLWMLKFTMTENCPSWSGFMQQVVKSDDYEKARIEILPFIHLDPTNPNTIYSALSFASKQCEIHNISSCIVTFDQPLYIKAAEIAASSSHLSNVIIRLGGFHLLMSYLGSIGFIMTGSGLDALWETVYAPASVVHMLTGHAYARAVRAHLLTSAAICGHMLSHSEFLNESYVAKLNEVQTSMLTEENFTETIEQKDILQEAEEVLTALMANESAKSRTGKLWINYMELVSLLKMFLYAERTGDWKLHLSCIQRMIPFFHAAGHLAYAKSARLYLQQMKQLQHLMTESEYDLFTTKGFFTIRRMDHFWSGNFTDQTIEQNLMRLLKSSGGMTHGRGITASSLTKWIHALPKCVPICHSLENFANVHLASSEQHKDLRSSCEIRDHTDYETFLKWLQAHSPFDFSNQQLVAISTGLVADFSANCDQAKEIGEAAANAITGKVFSEVKLKRSDKVTTISGANTIKVRGRSALVNPTLLFNRITCVLKNSNEMEEYLSYELSPQPSALFHDSTMRKTNKNALGLLLKSKVESMPSLPDNSRFIVDGGYLLRVVTWPVKSTYDAVCQAYVSYTLKHFGLDTLVVFDGYLSKHSTKEAEQNRRASRAVSRDILFDENMETMTTQAAFLANGLNKMRLITMLSNKFFLSGIQVQKAEADADRLIVSSSLSAAKESPGRPVVVIGTDTDLLVMLVAQATSEMANYMCISNPPCVYDILAVQKAIGKAKTHLMFIHAVTGCDTVSALYGQGKKKAFQLVQKDVNNFQFLDCFLNPESTKEQIASAGERFMLQLYGAHKMQSLDRLRYISYNHAIRKSTLSSSFKLESLPPTSAAAKQHSYRTFHTVQQWLGNPVNPTEWGWTLADGILVPVGTDQPVAPERLLKMVSCGCKARCGKACSCRKLGLHCSQMCSHCLGRTCSNIQVTDAELNEDI